MRLLPHIFLLLDSLLQDSLTRYDIIRRGDLDILVTSLEHADFAMTVPGHHHAVIRHRLVSGLHQLAEGIQDLGKYKALGRVNDPHVLAGRRLFLP